MDISLPAGGWFSTNVASRSFRWSVRYVIDGTRTKEWPHCRLATNKITGIKVFLKFFPRTTSNYENAVKLHKALESSRTYVCR